MVGDRNPPSQTATIHHGIMKTGEHWGIEYILTCTKGYHYIFHETERTVKSLISCIPGSRFPGMANSFEYDTEAQDRFLWCCRTEHLHIFSRLILMRKTCNTEQCRMTSLCPEYLQAGLQPDIFQLFAFIPEQYDIFIRFCVQFNSLNLFSWLPHINLNA